MCTVSSMVLEGYVNVRRTTAGTAFSAVHHFLVLVLLSEALSGFNASWFSNDV